MKQLNHLRLLLITAVIATLSHFDAFAYDFEVDGIYYNIKGNEVAVTCKETNAHSYSGDIVIPESVSYEGTTYAVTSIGDFAFNGCRELTSVSIPNTVTTIGYDAFLLCPELTEVTIPDSVTTIGNYAFNGCGLTSVTLGNSVEYIGTFAFAACKDLTSVTIPDSVIVIGYSAFSGCLGLTEFRGKFATEDNRALIVDGELIAFAPEGITQYDIPYSVTSIADCAFFLCSELTAVTIPDSVTKIGTRAFWDCYKLTSVKIPDAVTSISVWAFRGCYGLNSLSIGSSISKIDDHAFIGCDGLSTVIVGNPDPDSIKLGNGIFEGVPTETCILYVPEGSTELYRTAALWSDFANIKEYDAVSVGQTERIQSITTVDGGVLVNADNDGVIAIADMAGRVCYYNVYPGVNRISLESGIYVINNSKIIIK